MSDLIDPAEVGTRARLAGLANVPSNAAQSAIRDAPASGIDPSIGMTMPKVATQAALATANSGALQDPTVASWAAKAPDAHLAAAKNDLPAMANIGAKAILFGADANHSAFQPLQDIADSWNSQLNAISKLAQQRGEEFKKGDYLGAAKDYLSETMAGLSLAPTAALAPLLAPSGRSLAAISAKQPLNIPLVNQIDQFLKDKGLASTEDKPNFFQDALTQMFMTGFPEGKKAGGEPPVEPLVEPEEAPPAPQGLLPYGANPASDVFHEVAAEADNSAVAHLQDEIAQTEVHSAAPEVMKGFLDEAIPDKMAYVDAGKLSQLVMDDKMDISELQDFFDGQTDWDTFQQAAIDGTDHPIPMSTYLTATAGKPWAQAVNDITTFREGGVSTSDAKEAGDFQEAKLPPFDISRYSDLDPDEHEAIKNAIPAIEQRANVLAGELYLKDMFENNKALGLTKPEYERYSEDIRQAHLQLYDKMVEKLRKSIQKQKTEEWQTAYSQNFHGSMNAVMKQPSVRAAYALKYGTEEESSALTHAIKGPDGQPVTFYHGTNFTNITKWEVPKFSAHAGISLAESGPFGGDWALSKGTESYAGKYPVVYITHITAQKIGDFRNPADVKKALDIFVDARRKYLEKSGISPEQMAYRLEDYTATTRHALEQGDWRHWENKDMLKAAGWDAVRMLEDPHQNSTKPNIFVRNGDHVVFKWGDNKLQKILEKISLDPSVKNAYPKELIADLPKGIFAKGGLTADEVADKFGYLDGEAMLRDIAQLNTEAKASGSSLKNHILNLAHEMAFQKAEAELGWKLDPDSIMKEAIEGTKEPSPSDVILKELQILRGMLGDVPLAKADIEAYAQQRFGSMPVNQAGNIKQFQKQLIKAANATQKALQKGNFPKAFVHKQQQYVQSLFLEQAHEFRKEQARALKKVKSWRDGKFPAHMNPDFQAVVQDMVQQTGMGIRRNSAELSRYLTQESSVKSAVDAVNDMAKAGVPGYSPNSVNAITNAVKPQGGSNTPALLKVSVDTFRDWMNLTSSIAKFGSDAGTVEYLGERLEMTALTAQIEANVQALGERHTVQEITNAKKTWWNDTKNGVQSLFLINFRPEIYFNWMDQQVNGPFGRSVVAPLMEGKYKETDMIDSWVKAIKAIDAEHGIKATMTQAVVPPTISGTSSSIMKVDTAYGPVEVMQNRGNLRMALLHLGSESGRTKLLEGFGWGDEQEKWILDNVNEADVAFANAVWAEHAKLFPQSDQVYMRTRGYGLKLDTPRPVETKFGTLEGGYTRIKYNSALTDARKVGQPQSIAPPENGPMDQNFPASLLPSAAYTLERTNYTGGAMDLDHTQLTRSVAEIIHDIAFREPLIQAQKVLLDERNAMAIKRVLGPEYEKQVLPWLRYIAEERMMTDLSTNFATNFIRRLQRNLVFAKVAFNPNSYLKHGALGAVHMIGEARGNVPALVQAGADLFGNSAKANYWNHFVLTNSGEVRGAAWNLDTTIQDAIGSHSLTQDKLADLKDFGFAFFTYMKSQEAKVTWLSTYRREIAEHGIHDDAVAMANKAVRDTQGAGHAVDLPNIQRHGEFMREFARASVALLMNFHGTVANRLFVANNEFRQAARLQAMGKTAEAAAAGGRGIRIYMSYVIAAAAIIAAISVFIRGDRNHEKEGRGTKTDGAGSSFVHAFEWSLLDESFGSYVGASQLESYAHYKNDSTGGLLSSPFEDWTKLNDPRYKHEVTRNAWNLFSDTTGIVPNSVGTIPQEFQYAHDHSLTTEEQGAIPMAQRVLLGRKGQTVHQSRRR